MPGPRGGSAHAGTKGRQRPCRDQGERVDVAQRLDLLGSEGPLPADVAGEGQPPGEQRPEPVAVAGRLPGGAPGVSMLLFGSFGL
jgi:hypothetical protein